MGTIEENGEYILIPQQHEEVGQDHQKQREDAGALFVLKSKGSWVHCAYHLTTSIVAPALLTLPYAFRFLGWVGGVVCLVVGALATFYSYNLLSLVLEFHAELGHRQLRFRDMATHILGPKWGKYYVWPIQFVVCYGTVIGAALLGGECMKSIYLICNQNGTMKLYGFVIIFGCLMLVLAQVPSFHSLRHINLVSLILSLAYSACTTAGSIYIGNETKEAKDYSLSEDTVDRVFGALYAIAIISTTYGNGIIPEIQATLAPPVKGKMFKGLCLCYTLVLLTFFGVAVSGYWAFGNKADALILSNFLDKGRPNLVPTWFVLMTNIFTILQLSAVAVVYLQPTNEVMERTFADPVSGEFSMRNVIPRLVSRSLSVIMSTLIAAMFPFFGDINSLVGALGFMPLDFILPVVFFNLTFKPSKKSLVFWLNVTLAVVFSAVGVLASVSAVRQIILDAKTYRLFADL